MVSGGYLVGFRRALARCPSIGSGRCLEVSEQVKGQVRTGQVSKCQVRTGQVKSGKIKSGKVKSGKVESGKEKTDIDQFMTYMDPEHGIKHF